MKLLGLLMCCVHWGRSNCTRPVLMSVLDFFLEMPRRDRERDGRGSKKEHKEAKRYNNLRVRVNMWAKKE